jgi:hypothetical protein
MVKAPMQAQVLRQDTDSVCISNGQLLVHMILQGLSTCNQLLLQQPG